ncbi:hypothetical protein SRHO_G00078960 [Serrasalmus rhombeus]
MKAKCESPHKCMSSSPSEDLTSGGLLLPAGAGPFKGSTYSASIDSLFAARGTVSCPAELFDVKYRK